MADDGQPYRRLSEELKHQMGPFWEHDHAARAIVETIVALEDELDRTRGELAQLKHIKRELEEKCSNLALEGIRHRDQISTLKNANDTSQRAIDGFIRILDVKEVQAAEAAASVIKPAHTYQDVAALFAPELEEIEPTLRENFTTVSEVKIGAHLYPICPGCPVCKNSGGL